VVSSFFELADSSGIKRRQTLRSLSKNNQVGF